MTEGKKRRNLCSVISKTAGLLDRMARAQHTFHFALQIFWKHFFSLTIQRIMQELHENACRLPGEGYIICVRILQYYVQNKRCSFLF